MIKMVRLKLSNAYFLVGERLVLVDTGGPGEADTILAAVAQMGYKPADISLILHTHGHSDHAGSTALLRTMLAVPTALHCKDGDMARRGTNRELHPTRLSARLIKAMVNHPFEPFEPDIWLEGEFDLMPFGVQARVIPAPGHTRGSVLVLDAQGGVITGDLLMGGSMGGRIFSSWPRKHYFVESEADLRRSMAALAEFQPEWIYVGHGGPIPGARGVEFATRYTQE